MENQQATAFLQHLKVALLKFESAYSLLTEARAELHAVASNFKLDTVQLPEGAITTTTPSSTTSASDEGTFDVAIWRNDTGSKLKATGIIDGTDFRLLLFESAKEGIALSGSIVPKDAPEGHDLKEISLGYCLVKPKDDGTHELSIKFDQFDFWFNGQLAPYQNTTGNPKAPAFKATMHKSAPGGNKVKNAFADIMSTIAIPPAAMPVPAPVVDDIPFDAPQPVPVAPAAPQTLFEMAAQVQSQAAPAPTPQAASNTLFAAATTELPSLSLPKWMTNDD